MYIKSLVIAAFIFSSSAYGSESIINVLELAGKTKSEVSTLIGKPSSCSTTKYGPECNFTKAETKIVFINGKADWITVSGISQKVFADSAIEYLGFKSSKPSFSNAYVKRWEPLQGMLSVSIFGINGKADYAYIKVRTK